MQMPEPDQSSLATRDANLDALRDIVPGEGVIVSEAELRAYECDGLSAYRAVPLAVVLPSTTEQVSTILKLCDAEKIKVVPRGAGTSLSGGAHGLKYGLTTNISEESRVGEECRSRWSR
jgi:glycolate oxidase